MGICILGMGDCNTPSSTDISHITNNETNINNSIKNLISQNCKMNSDQDNTINIVGSTVAKLTASQKNSLKGLCIMQSVLDSTVSNEVQQKLLDAIKSNVETTGGFLGSPASNNTVSKSLSDNKNNINNTKFNEVSKDCILNTKQRNLLNIIGSSVSDSTIDQVNESFMKCLSQHSDVTHVSSDMLADTKLSTDNQAATSGGDLGKSVGDAAKGIGAGIGDAAKGVGAGVGDGAKGAGTGLGNVISAYTWPIAICCIVCVISLMVVAYMMLSNPEAVGSLANTASQQYKKLG